MYAVAYMYLCKSESFVYLSAIGQNKNAANSNAIYQAKRAAIAADSNNNNSPSVPINPKHKKINKLEVAEFIVARNIKMDLELMNSAVERKDLGDRELTKFVLRMNSKSCRELIDA